VLVSLLAVNHRSAGTSPAVAERNKHDYLQIPPKIQEDNAMSTVDDLLTQALALPEQERAAMATQLLHSLEPEDPGAEDAWADEIQARSDAVHSGNYLAHDWREAVEDIRTRWEVSGG
jgi:putative addiction module component (TIGR02574 family)